MTPQMSCLLLAGSLCTLAQPALGETEPTIVFKALVFHTPSSFERVYVDTIEIDRDKKEVRYH